MSPRISSQSTSSSRSRSSSSLSNPNVFSDDYALEPLDTRQVSPFDAEDDPSPVSAISLHTAATISLAASPESVTTVSIRPPSAAYRSLGHRDVASLLLNRSASSASNTFSDVHRASSTSSHFSMPRAQSPYVGATGPSHPYGMYPQITRASSIASASTVRPAERPFVAPSGPEHPYALYSQNTVPEEDAVSLNPATIPVGFPGMGQQYQGAAETRREDIADIVGPDGHIEELPPYTRYADENAPKETTSSIHVVSSPAAVPQDDAPSPQRPQIHCLENGVELNSPLSRNTYNDAKGGFKEKIKRKSRQRVCCGLPLCLFAIIVVLFSAIVLGGIIGGVIGKQNSHGTNASSGANLPPSTPTATMTEISFLDGVPLSTDSPIAAVPTGQFNVTTNNPKPASADCISNDGLRAAWACLAPMELGITVTGQGRDASLTLDPYPLDRAPLTYGAQRPDLSSRSIAFVPSMDKDNTTLGPALFANTIYDKLTIVHEYELKPSLKRWNHNGPKIVETGDKPWFCWFNDTLLEFFIYLDETPESSVTTTTSISAPLASSYNPTRPPPISNSSPTPTTSSPPTATTDHPTALPFEDDSVFPFGSRKSFPTSSPKSRRSGDDNNNNNNNANVNDRYNTSNMYPGLVKMEEKRSSSHVVQASCQQMELRETGELVAREGVKLIDVLGMGVTEVDEENTVERLMRRGIVGDCACEWVSGSRGGG